MVVSAKVTMMIRVAAGIIEQDGRLLICQRRAGGIFSGKWEFPGGKMRPSETPRQALERELREELSSAATTGDLLQIVRYRYAEMSEAVRIFFFSAALESPPRNLAFARIVWARRAELPRYDFLAADRHVISRLARGEIQDAAGKAALQKCKSRGAAWTAQTGLTRGWIVRRRRPGLDR